jgi:acetyltransferase-like isoleucine patch superfamily enzyme
MTIKIINQFLSKIKGQEYAIDPKTSPLYLYLLLLNRAVMLFRGKLSLIKNNGLLFIGRKVRIKARGRIKTGKGCTFEDYCYIDAHSYDGIVFGDNVSIGKESAIECSGSLKHLGVGIKVGNNVGLGRNCYYGCAGGIEIGSDTIIGNYVSLHSENHNATDLTTPIRLQGVNHKGIKIGNNCWIGAKVTILDGADIREGCIMAAGTVVKAGVYEAFGIYGGVPAKLIKKRE